MAIWLVFILLGFSGGLRSGRVRHFSSPDFPTGRRSAMGISWSLRRLSILRFLGVYGSEGQE